MKCFTVRRSMFGSRTCIKATADCTKTGIRTVGIGFTLYASLLFLFFSDTVFWWNYNPWFASVSLAFMDCGSFQNLRRTKLLPFLSLFFPPFPFPSFSLLFPLPLELGRLNPVRWSAETTVSFPSKSRRSPDKNAFWCNLYAKLPQVAIFETQATKLYVLQMHMWIGFLSNSTHNIFFTQAYLVCMTFLLVWAKLAEPNWANHTGCWNRICVSVNKDVENCDCWMNGDL